MNDISADTTDLAAIRDLLLRSQDAWNRGDGAAYAACFTADASDVTFVGTVYRGGTDIGRADQALFDSFLKDTRLSVDIIEIRRYGADAAVVLTRGDVAKKPPRRLGKLATYTVVRDGHGQAGGAWRIAAVQKTRRKPLMEAISFRLKPATRPTSA
jgi:uncharacterized protein (TIGR02246 family)